jgi:SAM-dependent methyltransferase
VSAAGHDPARWFSEHFEEAAGEVLSFLGGSEISIEGKRVADVGCGDGIIDLGLVLKGRPAELIGFDLMPVDREALVRAARAAGVAEELPAELGFMLSGATEIPAPSDDFDVIVSWSTFEHVDDPVGLLREVRRVLRPEGCFFLQLWPFYDSEHGGHLWPHYEGAFPHLLEKYERILERVQGRRATNPRIGAEEEYHSLNRITLDDLQRALMVSGLAVAKLKLLTEAVHIPPELSHRSLSELGIGGVELLAIPV